jgi:hypothetical protein
VETITKGTTRKLTWVSSGVTADSIFVELFSGSETSVASYAGVDSGDGHYYANVLMPNTPGFYAYRWDVTVSGLPYINGGRFRVSANEVD